MSTDPPPASETIAAGFEVFASGDVEAMRGVLHPDVEFVPSGAFPHLRGPYRGLAGFERWLADNAQAWTRFTNTPLKIVDVDAERALVTARLDAVSRETGAEVAITIYDLYTLRDGLLFRRESFLDRDAALAAAGLVEARD